MQNMVFPHIIDTLLKKQITYTIFDHKPVYTMEQACEVCGNLPEQNVKVLFARTCESKGDFGYCLVFHPRGGMLRPEKRSRKASQDRL